MKKAANLLIVLGSGLAAFGISGFGGSFSPQDVILPGMHGGVSGSVGWSQNNQIEIVIGVVSLICGVILRKDSK
jgi:hypothetical protein